MVLIISEVAAKFLAASSVMEFLSLVLNIIKGFIQLRTAQCLITSDTQNKNYNNIPKVK